MIELAHRAKKLPPPPHVVFESLTEPRRPTGRPWLYLEPDEQEPRVLVADPPERVVWSSLWPRRPHDEIHFSVLPHENETRLVFTHLSPLPVPDEPELRRLRRRINVLLWADLRESYDA